MATQVVELTSDEAALLRGLDKVIQKEVQHAKQLAETAAAGGKAGDEIAAGFDRAQRESEKSMKAALRELAKFGPAGQAAATELRSSFEASGSFGFKGLDTVFADLEKLDPAAAQAARSAAAAIQSEMAAADAATEFNNTLTAIEGLGGAASVAAKRVSDSLKEPGNNAEGLAHYLDELRSLGPAGEETADRIALEFEKVDQKTEFDQTLAKLRSLGGDARAIADGIAADMAAADEIAAGDMNAILEKLKSIEPTVEQSASTIKRQLEEAGRFSEKQYEGTLDKLRSMGPVGQAVAKELKEKLVGAGELAEESIDDVIATLKKIDPAAADAARAIHREMETASSQSDSSFSKVFNSTLTQMGSVVAAYASLDGLLSSVNQYLRDQEELLGKTLDQHLELAEAQQEAAKNLSGFDAADREYLLQVAAPSIARETGLSDMSAITSALGAAASSGADAAEAEEAVRQSARFEVNTPEQLGDTTAAAVAVQLATGLDDVRQTLALLQTVGNQSAITDQSKVAENARQALVSGVATVRNQDPEEAARQTGALFAQVTKAGADTQGSSSATFTTTVTKELDQFFSSFGDELIDARSKVQKLDKKIDKGTATEADVRDRNQLKEFVDVGSSVQKDLQGTESFETLFGRIETLQKFQPLATQFAGREGFGEARFQVLLKDILDANSEASLGLQEAFDKIRADASFFEVEAAFVSSGTPELAQANFRNRSASAQAAQLFEDKDGSALSAIREGTANALAETRTPGIGGFLSAQVSESFIRSGIAKGSTAAEESVDLILKLLQRRLAFSNDGLTEEEAPKVARLDAEISSIRDLLRNKAGVLAPGSLESASFQASTVAESINAYAPGQEGFFRDLAAEFREMRATIERQNAIAQQQLDAANRTADNTKPTTPDPGAAQRAAAAATR